MIKTSHLFILVISIFLISLFAIYWFIASSLFGNMCSFSVINEVSSEKFTASTISRGCGVGSSDYAFVNVRKKGEPIENSDYLSDQQIFLEISSEDEKIQWKNDVTLVIDCRDCLTNGIEKANSISNTDFKELKIEYQKE